MHIFDTLVVRIYAIALAFAMPALRPRAMETLALFILHLALLHHVISPYLSTPSLMSRVQRVLILASTLGLAMYAFVTVMFFSIVPKVLVLFQWACAHALSLESANQAFVPFWLEKVKTLQDEKTLHNLSNIDSYVVIVASAVAAACIETITAIVLPRANRIMFESERDVSPISQNVQVDDLVRFAMVAALGLGIGGASWNAISIRLVQILGQLPEYVGTTYESPSDFVQEVCQRASVVGGQFLLASAFGEQFVSGRSGKLSSEVLHVWILHVMSSILKFLPTKWDTDEDVWLYRPYGVLGQVFIALLLWKRGWHKYINNLSVEDGKEHTS